MRCAPHVMGTQPDVVSDEKCYVKDGSVQQSGVHSTPDCWTEPSFT